MLRIALAALGLLLVTGTPPAAASPLPTHARDPVIALPQAGLLDTPATPSAREAGAANLSDALSRLTGLGISPLMTMSALCWIDGWRHDPQSGPAPWYTETWFAGTITLIALLALCSRLFGTALPTPVRKVLRAVELQERKISALIAAGIFFPMIASMLETMTGTTAVAGQPVSAAGLGGLASWVVCATVMGTAWTVSQAIESLIFLSPLALLDAALMVARTMLLMLIGVAGAFAHSHPYLVSLPILLVLLAAFLLIAGWCVRLNLFVGTFAFDILLRRWNRPGAGRGPYLAFLGAGNGLAPARVRCQITREGERTLVRWRRMFVGPARIAEISAPASTLVRGVVWHEMHAVRPGGRGFWLSLPPRYRVHERALVSELRVHARDGLLLRGWSGVREACRRLFARDAVG